MEIQWDQEKNEWLMLKRNICFEKIAGMLMQGDYLDILENPTRAKLRPKASPIRH